MKPRGTGRTMHNYLYDSTEQTATCCLGDVFFRKRRLTSASDYYSPTLKPKIDDDDVNDNNEDTSGRLASWTERAVAGAGPGISLNSKYQASSDDNSRGTRLAGTPDNDSYSRAVSHPVTGSRHGSLQDSSDPPPPRYTEREDTPVSVPVPSSAASCRSRPRPRGVSASRLAKEHEVLQNMWLDNHGRRQRDEQRRADNRVRRSSSLGATGSGRTVYITDRATGTRYRRGRLLGKVRA